MSMTSLNKRLHAIEALNSKAHRQLMVIVDAHPDTPSSEIEQIAHATLAEQDREIPKRHILRFNCGARESVMIRGKWAW